MSFNDGKKLGPYYLNSLEKMQSRLLAEICKHEEKSDLFRKMESSLALDYDAVIAVKRCMLTVVKDALKQGALTMDRHKPVERLEELLALDIDEVINGYCSTEPGDPEPGINHSRAFHHGWRMKMMDLREIECPRVGIAAYYTREKESGCVMKSRSGGSQRTAIVAASPCSGATTVAGISLAASSLAPANILFCERLRRMQCSSGASTSAMAASLELNAPSFGRRDRIKQVSLSARLTRSLISAGLVKGITPSSTRKRCGEPCRVIASYAQGGLGAG